MKPGLLTAQFHGLLRANSLWLPNHNHHPFLRPSSSSSSSSSSSLISVISHKIPSPRRITLCALKSSEADSESTTNQIPETSLNANFAIEKDDSQHSRWRAEVGSSIVPMAKLNLSDQAFFLLAFIACTTSVAFLSLVIAAVPTLYAMGRAAISLSKLADTAREELPSTMAAIRLSSMEISDLTLEMSDLSQEIADGVNKSAQAVQAAEAGIRQIGSLARQQTMLMIEERANLPIISLQPVVAGAAKKTTRAIGKAAKSLINLISGGELGSESKRLEI